MGKQNIEELVALAHQLNAILVPTQDPKEVEAAITKAQNLLHQADARWDDVLRAAPGLPFARRILERRRQEMAAVLKKTWDETE